MPILARYSTKAGTERLPRAIKLNMIGTMPSATTPSQSFAEKVVTLSETKNQILLKTSLIERQLFIRKEKYSLKCLDIFLIIKTI